MLDGLTQGSVQLSSVRQLSQSMSGTPMVGLTSAPRDEDVALMLPLFDQLVRRPSLKAYLESQLR